MTARQVRALLAAQMPDLAGLPLRRVGAGGSDHWLFRLGPGQVVRLPRIAAAAGQAAAIAPWMAGIAAVLPLAVPGSGRQGRPGSGYPFPWEVLPWIAGRDGWDAPPLDGAGTLAQAVAALRALPVAQGAPRRGRPLAARDGFLRQMIGQLRGEADPDRVAELWRRCLDLPGPRGTDVWGHGDLHPLNLVTRRRRLVAVIDWGAAGVGDGAEDLLPAWAVLDAPGRAAFRAALEVDPQDWARGWALAFSKAVMAAPYYRDSNPRLAAMMRRLLQTCLAEAEAVLP